MSDLQINHFLNEIEKLSAWKSGQKVSPNKFILLLAVLELIEENKKHRNAFPFNDALRQKFDQLMEFFFQEKKTFPEYPYYHLATSHIWNHEIRKGKEEEYQQSRRFTPKKIQELIDFAYLDPDFYTILKNKKIRIIFKDKLKDKILKIKENIDSQEGNQALKSEAKKSSTFYPKTSNGSSGSNMVSEKRHPQIKSNFLHEQKALEDIFSELENHTELIPNFDLYDPSTNQYLECDLIVVSTDCLAIVELKHWAGKVEIRPNHWLRGAAPTSWRDPHISNSYKCKVLKSFCTRNFPYINNNYWFESIVLLTNPDAIVYGSSPPDTKLRNPTFDGIKNFAKYFKRRLSSPNPKLNKAKVKQVADRIRAENQAPRRKGLHIPGYEILENLTHSSHLVEVLARPVSNDLQTVKLLRIFSMDPALGPEDREKQRTKSRNSLKALSSVSDHPNILKVWDLYHEDGLVIEASDWSQEEGTLANVLDTHSPFPLERSIPILRGIAEGLSAVHENGIVHRDLSPENIMMFGDTPKLMNFDLSYLPEDNRLTVLPDDVVLKKSPYLAPELYARQPFSEATDLFSLGVIAFQMLTGELPFDHSTDLLAVENAIEETVEAKLLEADVPEALRIDIGLMIQLDRAKRPQDIGDILANLTDSSEEPEPEPKPPPEPNRVLPPGEIFGVYTVLELIGRGREAQVYKAERAGDRAYALKLFNHDVPVDRVAAEGRALENLDSPYIVGYKNFDLWDGDRYYLILDMVPGEALRTKIEANERPALDEFQHVANCLMEAIQAMHRNPARETPLLHNDLKPDNIILNTNGDPVLIDFGTAAEPKFGPYMGTEGYVAPDLFMGAEYDFCESADLFALGVTLFEWLCGNTPYAGTPAVTATPRSSEELRENLPAGLSSWLARAVQPRRDERFQDIAEMKTAFDAIFQETEELAPPSEAATSEEPETAAAFSATLDTFSPKRENFLDYLNTLHNTTAENRNALAESQARSRFFGAIHVPWPLTDRVYDLLTDPNGDHVILTGHAGDGKSTIGLEIYKRLKGIPMEKPLETGLADHEEIALNGSTIHLIKDMSELPAEERPKVISRAVEGDGRWLIISNTGALLENLEKTGPQFGKTELEIGDELLGLLEKKEAARFTSLGATFTLFNLSQLDNLEMVRQLFVRFVNEENWNDCENCRVGSFCPVQVSLRAIRVAENRVADRIGLIFRLLYEYGQRLTLRQASAHLAYALTGGLHCKRIRELAESPTPPPLNEFLFYNRFFGFRGVQPDERANRLKGIQMIRPMEMGARPFIPVDRAFWTSEEGMEPNLPVEFHDTLTGLREDTASGFGSEIFGARLRQEFRRLFFVFGEFGDPQIEKEFVSGFTGSPMLVETESWQTSPSALTARRREELKRKVLHVLLEQYTGFSIPEKRRGNELLITLNRRNEALRQSVQILLADIPFSNFELKLREIYKTFRPQRYVLTLQDRYVEEFRLVLDLPFLDFVLLRSSGELGQRLNRGYLDRLERFKNLLLSRVPGVSAEEMRLVQLNNDGKLEQFRAMISDDLLEVL